MDVILATIVVLSLVVLTCVLLVPRLVLYTKTHCGSTGCLFSNFAHDDNERLEVVVHGIETASKSDSKSRTNNELSSSSPCRDSAESLSCTQDLSEASTRPRQIAAAPSLQRSISEPLWSALLRQSSVAVAGSEDIGRKSTQEDCHLIETESLPPWLNSRALVGIFDGHNGSSAAEYVRENLLALLTSQSQGPVLEALKKALLDCEAGLYDAYKANPSESAGTTAVVALVQEQQILLANIGDSRAVISRNGVAKELTTDQKPSLPTERERILLSGGFLDSEHYINGEIGVARALGNFHLTTIKKPPSETPGPLTAEPYITSYSIDLDEEFLVLASDGLWDVMSSQRAVQIARSFLVKNGSCEEAAAELIAEAKRLETRDNATVVIVALKPLPLIIQTPRPKQRNKNSRLFTNVESSPTLLYPSE